MVKDSKHDWRDKCAFSLILASHVNAKNSHRTPLRCNGYRGNSRILHTALYDSGIRFLTVSLRIKLAAYLVAMQSPFDNLLSCYLVSNDASEKQVPGWKSWTLCSYSLLPSHHSLPSDACRPTVHVYNWLENSVSMCCIYLNLSFHQSVHKMHYYSDYDDDDDYDDYYYYYY